MTLWITAADAIAACNALTARLHTGNNAAPVLEVYSGNKPASIGTALTNQVLLVSLALDETKAFADAADVGGQPYVEGTAAPIEDTPAAASGTANWFRVKDSAGVVRWLGDVTEANLGGDLELSSVNVIQGVNVVTVSLKARFPKGVA